MSAADIITDPAFPHGTADGFRGGCKGGNCPAPVACRTVHVRYQGDFAFRRQIDAGMTPAEIVEQERTAPKPVVVRGKVARNRQYVRRTPGEANTPYQKAIKKLLGESLSDKQIAERLGKTRDQICATRNFMKLPPNRETPATAGVSS